MTDDYIKTIAIILGGISAFGFAIGYFYVRIIQGKKSGIEDSSQITDFWKKRADDYKLMLDEKESAHIQRVKDLSEQVNNLTREVGELRGQLNSEKKQNDKLEQIFQNRDPETKEFMLLMIKAVADQNLINKEVVGILKEIHNMSKLEHERDFSVTSTITKQ